MPILETLPGWPAADEPSVFAILIVLVFIPLAIAALFTAIGMAGRWRRQDPALEPSPDGGATAALGTGRRGGSHAVAAPAQRAALAAHEEAVADDVADLREAQTQTPSSARA